MRRTTFGVLWMAGLGLLGGCHADQVTQQFSLSFDRAIGRLYEAHVLNNLARCDNHEFFVQMAFANFGSDITQSGSLSAQFTLFNVANRDDGTNDVNVNVFDQSFSPTLSASQSNRLGFTASPATSQAEILGIYRQATDKEPPERFFRRTDQLADCSQAYCYVPYGLGCWYIVPKERKAEFTEFVHAVSFYIPPISADAASYGVPAPTPGAPASGPPAPGTPALGTPAPGTPVPPTPAPPEEQHPTRPGETRPEESRPGQTHASDAPPSAPPPGVIPPSVPHADETPSSGTQSNGAQSGATSTGGTRSGAAHAGDTDAGGK